MTELRPPPPGRAAQQPEGQRKIKFPVFEKKWNGCGPCIGETAW